MKRKKLYFFSYSLYIVLGILLCSLILFVSILYSMNKSVDASILNSPSVISQSPNSQDMHDVQNDAIKLPSDTKNLDKPTTDIKPIQPKTVSISAVGDIMVHKSNLNSAYNHTTKDYDFNGFFEYVKPILSTTDITIGNFETVTGDQYAGFKSFPRFNSPDSLLSSLSNIGFDILSTANNHCIDMGLIGLERTINKIAENNMINVGSSIDGNNKYITKEINGIKISFLPYTYSFNGNDAGLNSEEQQLHLSRIDELQIQKDIQAVKSAGTDVIIVIMHWGTEYQRIPNTTQTEQAKKLFGWGADIILGSHPHVLQKSEVVKVNGEDKYIIYSMGNFISGYRRTDTAKRPNKVLTEDGVIVQLEIEKKSDGNIKINKIQHIPTWVHKYYENKKLIYKVLPIPNSNFDVPYINKENIDMISNSYNNTMSIMTDKNK